MISQSNIKINFITDDETMDLRSRILRPGQPLEACRYEEDKLSSTFHLGIKENGAVICNGTFIFNVCPLFPKELSAYRLRGMATEPKYRGLHLGSKLLQAAEKILIEKGCHLLWFNARESAFAFYEKNQYEGAGELFDLPLIGPHRVMYKKLSIKTIDG